MGRYKEQLYRISCTRRKWSKWRERCRRERDASWYSWGCHSCVCCLLFPLILSPSSFQSILPVHQLYKTWFTLALSAPNCHLIQSCPWHVLDFPRQVFASSYVFWPWKDALSCFSCNLCAPSWSQEKNKLHESNKKLHRLVPSRAKIYRFWLWRKIILKTGAAWLGRKSRGLGSKDGLLCSSG